MHGHLIFIMGIPIPGELIFLLNQPPSHGPLILFYIYPPTHQYQYCPSLNQHSPVFQFQQCCWSHLVGWRAILCNHVGWGNQWPITQIPQSDDQWWQPAINKETTRFTRFLSSLHPLCLCHSFHADFFFKETIYMFVLSTISWHWNSALRTVEDLVMQGAMASAAMVLT